MYKDIKVDPAQLEAALDARLKIRAGFDKPTAGMAAGMTQVNMISVPKEWAYDFLLYAHTVTRKAARCLMCSKKASMQLSLPQTQTSELTFHVIAFGKDGEMVDEVTDAREIYNAHPDLVTFLDWLQFFI